MDLSIDHTSLSMAKFSEKFIGDELLTFWGYPGTIMNLSVEYSSLKLGFRRVDYF